MIKTFRIIKTFKNMKHSTLAYTPKHNSNIRGSQLISLIFGKHFVKSQTLKKNISKTQDRMNK